MRCKTLNMAIVVVTKRGLKIASKIEKAFSCDIYIKSNYIDDKSSINVKRIKGNFIRFVHSIFPKYDQIVFITATGIAVRSIAGVVEDKRYDPAIVVIDEQGRYCISLLSGHFGGANELARKLSKTLNAQPIITTASDGQGFEGIDTLAKELGLYIDNFKCLKYVSSALVNGCNVAFLGDEKELLSFFRSKLKQKTATFNKKLDKKCKAAVFITDKEVSCSIPHVILRPRKIVLGIGARKNTPYKVLQKKLDDILKSYNLSKKSIYRIASIDVKKHEKCILKLGEELGVPLIFYSAEELKTVESLFHVSDFVRKTVGVGSVAKPAAYMASNKGSKILYYAGSGITLAVYKRGIL